MNQRFLGLTVLLTASALAYSAPSGTNIVCMVVGAFAFLCGPRFEVDRVAQAAVSVVAMMGGVFAARLTPAPEDSLTTLSERTLLLGLPMLFIAAARSCLVKPIYGDRLTLLAALVALTASGRVQSGWAFPIFAALVCVAGLLAARAADPSRPPLAQLERRHYIGMGFGLATAAGLAVFATWTLPRAHEAMIARFMARGERDRTGISDSMSLGSMEGMFQSDSVVVRLRGGAPPLLRGVVLSSYTSSYSRWEISSESHVREVVETQTEPASPGMIEAEYASRGRRYFLPLGARDVTSSSGFYERDIYGIARPNVSLFGKRLWFREGEPPSVPAPTLTELEVPARIFPELRAILDDWGATDKSPREVLEIIERRLLTDYTYSLEFQRTPRIDPVLDFLRNKKEGHCEYFASAFALLARAAKVPTRVVAGYRVTEQSPFGYHIVRERNAHSWVEAWVDDRWVTYDPTPAGDLAASAPTETPWLSALFDGIRTGWESVDDWFTRRSAFELSLALSALVGALLMVRALRGYRGKTRSVAEEIPYELVALARALKARGVERAPHETLGALARRVLAAERLSEETRAEIAAALTAYERFRYGGDGDPTAALGDLQRAAARL